MRLGMSGCFLPDNMDDLTEEMCKRVRDLGFTGIFTRFRQNDPHTTTKAQAQRVRDLLAANGVRMFQATGYWQNMITPDETQRKEAVKTVQAALRLAGWMGARGIDTGPGSMNPDGPWFPHPANWTLAAKRQLVKTLKECAQAAEDAGVFLSLESHQLVTLKTPEITKEVLDEVGSPWVRCDYDSANWITLETIFDTTAALNHHFDLLGDHIVSCHAKDIWIENRLTLHLQDGCPGRGLMDFTTLFQRMEALNPDYPVIAEGNTTAELPAVSALFHATAAELGIRILDVDEQPVA
ncbi:MAG TPA: sugar phosphate isomerase/epimerase family protein [Caldilineaceae bacterium]|nr:sugar phosphate isomerase/epimerase family protein [Caldilineaceae bacterium]